MTHRLHIKDMGWFPLYGLALVWSPIFGTSEAVVFPALAGAPEMVIGSRIANLAGFALVMLALAVLGERYRPHRASVGPLALACAAGVFGTAVGCAAGVGALPVWTLPVGGAARGICFGMVSVVWIDLLIHVPARHVGAMVAAALAAYAAAGAAIWLGGLASPLLAAAMLCACPALTCLGCHRERARLKDLPVAQERSAAPVRTRAVLYGANLLFGAMLGAILHYFALADTLVCVLAFLATAAALLAAFALAPETVGLHTVFRAFMLCFSALVLLLVAAGPLDGEASAAVASSALAVIVLYTVVIFADTQARFRRPFWRIAGVCQIAAAVGMGCSTLVLWAAPGGGPGLDGGMLDGPVLLLIAAACVIFVAGLFSPTARTQVRPWGFSSLIPAESPQIRRLRRCGELADEFGLTARELEILQQLSNGATKDDVASALVISPATAKTHIRNIYGKLGVHSQKGLQELIDDQQ